DGVGGVGVVLLLLILRGAVLAAAAPAPAAAPSPSSSLAGLAVRRGSRPAALVGRAGALRHSPALLAPALLTPGRLLALGGVSAVLRRVPISALTCGVIARGTGPGGAAGTATPLRVRAGFGGTIGFGHPS